MFNLTDILQSAQGGQAIDNLAGQFGLSSGQAQQAVASLLPALSAGLKSRAGDPASVAGVISQVSDPQHQAAFQSSDAAQSDDAQMAGQQALNQLVGGDDAVAAIAQRAADETGLSPEILQQMLPQITSVALGGVMTAMQNRGLGGVVGQLGQMANSGGLAAALGQGAASGDASGQQSGSTQQGGLGGLISGLVGSFLGGRGQQQQQGEGAAPAQSDAAQAGLSALTQLFDHGASASPDLEQDFAQLIGKSS